MADPFVTAAELREFMGDGAPTNPRAEAMVNYVSALIRRSVSQLISQVTADVVIFGRSGDPVIVLPEKPVTAVAEVLVDAVALGATEFYWTRSGDLYRFPLRTAWSFTDHVEVTYDHGYPDGSEELEAVKSLCLQVTSRAISMNKGPEFDQFAEGGSEASGFAPEAILYRTERDLLENLGKVAMA